jgi:hypothetical protein
MITHALAFLPAADVLACSVRTSRQLVDVLKGTASVAAMWEGSLKRDFPIYDLPSVHSIQAYRFYYEARDACNRCDGVFFAARLTRCEFCNEHVCDACERCACNCETCFAPCLDDGDHCYGCSEQTCGDCRINDYEMCSGCMAEYCEKCTKNPEKTNWRVCQNPTVRTLQLTFVTP